MMVFEDIDTVIEWLEPLGYEAFWREVEPHDIFAPGDRPHCDWVVAEGIATYETVLTCLKATVRLELMERHGLQYRSTLPPRPDLKIVH